MELNVCGDRKMARWINKAISNLFYSHGIDDEYTGACTHTHTHTCKHMHTVLSNLGNVIAFVAYLPDEVDDDDESM